MTSTSSKLWVVLDDAGRILHSSFNPDNLDVMKKYVRLAQEAGDGWRLVEYHYGVDLACGTERSVTQLVTASS